MDVARKGAPQVDDQVADELSGLVEGHIPAPLRAGESDPTRTQSILGEEDVLPSSRAAPRDGWRVLEKPEEVGDPGGAPLLRELSLRSLRRLVLDRPSGRMGRALRHACL